MDLKALKVDAYEADGVFIVLVSTAITEENQIITNSATIGDLIA